MKIKYKKNKNVLINYFSKYHSLLSIQRSILECIIPIALILQLYYNSKQFLLF